VNVQKLKKKKSKKVNFTLEEAIKAQRKRRYIALLSLPWHQMDVGGQRHTPPV
jgi:hypothetical protein